MKNKNDKIFNKDGQPTRRKFRVYCGYNDKGKCKNFIMGKWGGGYACIQTKEGRFDWRNQIWVCDNHKDFKKVIL